MEVQVGGVWGVVCPSDLSRWREEGRVVCRSLQKEYFKSVGTAFPTGYSGVRYSGQLVCSGSEAYPENCNFQFSRSSCRNALTVDCTDGRLGQCMYVVWGGGKSGMLSLNFSRFGLNIHTHFTSVSSDKPFQ